MLMSSSGSLSLWFFLLVVSPLLGTVALCLGRTTNERPAGLPSRSAGFGRFMRQPLERIPLSWGEFFRRPSLASERVELYLLVNSSSKPTKSKPKLFSQEKPRANFNFCPAHFAPAASAASSSREAGSKAHTTLAAPPRPPVNSSAPET